jgi:hypothetical protein
MVTNTDKGNSLVIIYCHDYDRKVQNFINDNSFFILRKDPTQTFQRDIRKSITSCDTIVPKETKWKFIRLNSSPPKLHALAKVHKVKMPVRPVISWQSGPSYKLAKHLVTILNTYIPLPYVYNIKTQYI